jgi:glycerate kinase
MKKVLLLPDSFKGTMRSEEICEIMERAIKDHFPACEVISIPVADGGEGTVSCFHTAIGGEMVSLPVKGPYMEDREGFYGVLPDGTAVIEMAAAAGLPLVGEDRRAEKTTTFGVGQLLLDAVNRGCKKVIIGLGGSATNDLGCGMAVAMGAKFYDRAGRTFTPVGETLGNITKIDVSEIKKALVGVEVVSMCDIDNPLYGKDGAAYVFAPQKGADQAMVQNLDQNLRMAAAVIKAELGSDVSMLPGAGAAGGMGAGTVAFLGATLQRGIEVVLDTVNFDNLVQGTDFVFTGEGSFDRQSLYGKVVIGVGRRAKDHDVPVIAMVGAIDDHVEEAYYMGIVGIFSINRKILPFAEIKAHSADNLFLAMDNLMRFMKSCKN